MKELFKRLVCFHKWEMIGNPYLYDTGRTKRVDVRCTKCGKQSNVDIFDTPKGMDLIKRWEAIQKVYQDIIKHSNIYK